MKSTLLIQDIIKLSRKMKTFLETFIGRLRNSVGTTYSTMEKAILSILINCLELWESLEKTLVVNLASLIHCSTQSIIILLKIFEKLTTLSTKIKTKALEWWRLRQIIRLTRFLGNRRSTLKNLRVRLRMRREPKPTSNL